MEEKAYLEDDLTRTDVVEKRSKTFTDKRYSEGVGDRVVKVPGEDCIKLSDLAHYRYTNAAYTSPVNHSLRIYDNNLLIKLGLFQMSLSIALKDLNL